MPDSGQIRASGCDHLRENVNLRNLAAFAGPELDFSGWSTVGQFLRFLASFRFGWDDAYAGRSSQVWDAVGRCGIAFTLLVCAVTGYGLLFKRGTGWFRVTEQTG